MTKYCSYIEKPEDLLPELEKAYTIAMDGRCGPVVLDVPMNVQRADIVYSLNGAQNQVPNLIDENQLQVIIDIVKTAKDLVF